MYICKYNCTYTCIKIKTMHICNILANNRVTELKKIKKKILKSTVFYVMLCYVMLCDAMKKNCKYTCN